MDDLDHPTCNTDYNSFEDRGSKPLWSRSQPSNQLEEDLKNTASGTRREARRTTKKTQFYKISADSDEESDSTIDEDYDVDSILSSIEEGLSWRGRLQRSLHNNVFHIIIVVLVCLDALIVVFELLLDVGAFNNRRCIGRTPFEQHEFCHHDTDGECGPTAKQILRELNVSARPPSGNGTGLEDLCVCNFRRGSFGCYSVDEPSDINPAKVLHIVSLVILTVFMIEIILKIIAFRLKYFTHKFEVFDGMVVVVSWVLDIASIVEEEAFEAAALIIILRLWRVVRIVNGAVLSSKAQSDRQLEYARAEARRIIHAFHKCQDRVDVLEEEKIKLISAVKGSGGRVPSEIKYTNNNGLL